MRKEAKKPLLSPKVDQSHEGNEVDNTREVKKEACMEVRSRRRGHGG